MGFGYTPNLNLAKPEYGEQGVNWWNKINENFDKMDFVGPLGGGAYTAGSIVFAGAGGVLGQDNATLFWDNAAKVLKAPAITLSGMTQGSIPYIGASGAVSQDNANFFWDGASKALRIFDTDLRKGAIAGHLTFRHKDANTATRFYVTPNGSPSGTTSAFKIFADDYEADSTNYRDFGLYFDTVSGQFRLNSKSNGSYANVPASMAFTFQDGARTSGEVFQYDVGGTKYAGFALGGGLPSGVTMYAGVPIFLRSDAIFDNGKMLRFYDAQGLGMTGIKGTNQVLEFSANGVKSATIAEKYMKAEKAFALARTTGTAGDAAPDVGNASFIQIPSNSGAYTVTNFANAIEGQELIVLFSDGNCTIENNSNIKLAGAVNFVGTNSDILTLIKGASCWFEKARSIN